MYDDFWATTGRVIFIVIAIVFLVPLGIMGAKKVFDDDSIAAPVKCTNCVSLSDLDSRYVRTDDSGNDGSGSGDSSVQSKTYNGTRDNIEVQVASDSVFVIGGEEFTVGGKTYKNTVKTFEGGNTYTDVSITNGFIVLGPQGAVNDKVDELKDTYVN